MSHYKKKSVCLSKSDLPNTASARFCFVISYIAIDPSAFNIKLAQHALTRNYDMEYSAQSWISECP